MIRGSNDMKHVLIFERTCDPTLGSRMMFLLEDKNSSGANHLRGNYGIITPIIPKGANDGAIHK